MTTFYLGTHMPHWLGQVDVPLFVSHRRLNPRKSLPRASARWALDSGGFTEIAMHGQWDTTSDDYVVAVKRYRDEIGLLDWCAPQDWMCEPSMLARTGLTVGEHQARTVASYLELREHLGELVAPVLQGWEPDDYRRCVDLYDQAGVRLDLLPTVGVGSVCRRNADSAIGAVIRPLANLGLRLHGFGVRGSAYASMHHLLTSADSMAWSARGRRDRIAGHPHKSCANCLSYALAWRDRSLHRAQWAAAQLPLWEPA